MKRSKGNGEHQHIHFDLRGQSIATGQKFFVLAEMGKFGKILRARIDVYPRNWEYEELSQALEAAENGIWQENNPEDYLIEQYLNLTHPEGKRFPSSIRVPRYVIESIQQERELSKQRRKKEHDDLEREAAAWAKKNR